MQPMHSAVIADTSCFILLIKIDEIGLLRQIYNFVYTTPEVAKEFGHKLPDWIIIEAVKNLDKFHLLENELDKGEASAIALSYEIENVILILDDLAARKVALRLKVSFTGTFGIIAKAKQQGIIPSVKPILDKVRQTNFRFSEDIFIRTLNEAGEL
jgi:predicted nucleic acid-binding protein